MLKILRKNSIKKNLKKKFKKKELYALVLKNLNILNIYTEEELAYHLPYKLLLNVNLRGVFKNSCVFSGRTNGYYRMFQVSRFFIKALISQKLLIGVYKANF